MFSDIEQTHGHEEKLRAESLALIQEDIELSERLDVIQRAMKLIFVYTVEYQARSDDEGTIQLLGVRLFNAGASAIKLALAGYYQSAFQQARDIMEVGYLLDYFRTSPEQCCVWRGADRNLRKKNFSPVQIRMALDKRDQDTSRRREAEYGKLSELASHATTRSFQLIRRGGVGELGPFVEKRFLLAWLEEMVLRLGPAAFLYGSHFPNADSSFANFREEFGVDLVGKFKRRGGSN